MNVILAPDSFKGSLTQAQAAEAMAEGVRMHCPNATLQKIPIADGGEGTIDVLAKHLDGEMVAHTVPGPYGKPIKARYLHVGDTAYIELAQASGLTLTTESERNPIYSSTYGTGLQIADALDRGAAHICLTLGGSATNDGGAGIARALGIRLLDGSGMEVPANCKGLEEVAKVDSSAMHPALAHAKIVVATDVTNLICGAEGASAVYGPQKGADLQMVLEMDEILYDYRRLLERTTGKELREVPGLGAAGGAAVPLYAFANAEIVSGIDMVLDAAGFDDALAGGAMVLTGEGKVDAQTGFGKAIQGIYARASAREVPVHVFAGVVEMEKSEPGGISYHCINPAGEAMEDSIANAYENLKNCVAQVLGQNSAGTTERGGQV